MSADFCDRLGSGDLLFIDGSHRALNGSDVPFLYLEVLPRLKPGVLVHVHDMNLPFEYNELFTGGLFSEQYVVAAMLLYGDSWEVLLPVFYLSRNKELNVPFSRGGSFWMRKKR